AGGPDGAGARAACGRRAAARRSARASRRAAGGRGTPASPCAGLAPEAVSRSSLVPTPRSAPGVGLEEAPHARRRGARPAVPLRALAVDDLRDAPRVARAAVALDGCAAAVGPRPPVARAAHQLGAHDAVGAAID